MDYKCQEVYDILSEGVQAPCTCFDGRQGSNESHSFYLTARSDKYVDN